MTHSILNLCLCIRRKLDKINRRKMAYPLEINHLVKNYAEVRAVSDVSFCIEPGEIFGLLGPNGAGKTSIISILSTLEKPTGGIAKIFGNDVTLGLRQTKAFLGVVPQEIVSHGFFNVREVLEFYSGYYGIKNNRDHIEFLLKRLGLKDHAEKRVRQMSGGMKRRLLIAKALVHKPKLLLLDEPTAGVDVELRNSLWNFVRELNQEGMSILLTTHYLEEAENLCNRVGIIHHGKLLKVGSTKELVSQMTMREISVTFNEPVGEIQNPYLISRAANSIQFRIPNEVVLGELFQQSKIPVQHIKEIKIREGRLEDAFLNLVEKA